jgi:hypothetical protein
LSNSVVGTHTRHAGVDTQNSIESIVSSLHGRLYLSSNNDYDMYIGAPDGSLIKIGAKGNSTSVWGVSTTGYHDNIQATTDGHVLRRSGGVLGFGTITSSSISDVGTIVQGSGITLTGTLTNRLVGSGNLTIAHADTSSFSKSSLTGATVISNLTVDTYGHITDWTTRNITISDIISIPNQEVVFGTGTGVSSSSGFKYTTLGSVQIGTGTASGTYSFQMGAGSVASYYTMNIGGGTVNNKGNCSLIICGSGSGISGSGDATVSVLLGGNDNKVISDYAADGSVIIGATNTVTSTTKTTTYNRILGNNNTITDAYYCNILGESNNITTSGAFEAYNNNVIGYYNTFLTTNSTAGYNFIAGTQSTIDGGNFSNIIGRYGNNGGYSGVLILADGNASTMTANASNQFNARFYGGYRFMKDGSTQWMAIANTGYVTINNIPTAASATDILVSNGGVVSTRSLSSLNIPTALWSDSGGYIEPLSNSWIQLKPVVGKGSVRLSSDNDSGIIEVFNDDSSQTLTIKSDSNDDVSYNIKTGKVHKFNEKVSIGYIPVNTTSTSYLVDNSGVIEKRSLPIASSSTLGVIKIGDTLQIDGNGVINTYLQDDFVYDFTSTDRTNNSNLTPVEAMSIPLSVGMWEVNIIAGYKFETTSTGTRLSLGYSEPGFTMHGKLAATINSNNNSEITSKTANGMDISSVNTANSEYALTGKIIIRATAAGDLSLKFLSLTNGSTVTIMQYSAMTARKLDIHAP